MDDFFFSLKPYIPYLIIFPCLLTIFLLIATYICKKNINNKNAGFFGIFMSLNNFKTLSLSFVLAYYFFIIESIIINRFSIINLIILLILGVLANIICLNWQYIILSIINSTFIYIMVYFQKIFISYTLDVDKEWYIIALAIVLSIFGIVFGTFFSLKNSEFIIFKNKQKRCY